MKQVDQERTEPQQQPQGDAGISGKRQPNQSPPDSGRERIQRVSAPIDTSSVEVDKVLPEWIRNSDGVRTLFPNHSPRASGRSDFDEVEAKRTRATTGRTIAYCSFENPWGKSGGINAVASMLPKHMREANERESGVDGKRDEIIRLSPLHSGLGGNLRLPIELGLLDDAENLATASANADHSANASLWLVPGKLRSRVENQAIIVERRHPQKKDEFKIEVLFRYEADCYVPFRDPDDPHRPKHRVRVFRFTESNGEEWILFDTKEFFNADGGSTKDDPYVYSDETAADQRDGETSKLLRDSLFASRAVPEVLQALGKTRNVIVHAQDWEFAAAALTVKETLCDDDSFESAAVVLTLHNLFDHSLSTENLKKITDRWSDDLWPALADEETCPTVLTRMIPLVDAPISTVSRVFAVEFRNHPLQTGHFARHCQEELDKQEIVGIDNGVFEARREYSAGDLQAIKEAKAGDPNKILAAKRNARRIMLKVLESFLDQHKEETSGTLQGVDGRPLRHLPDEVPVFLMVGRLDPGQKGFDLLIRALEGTPPGTARFIISPLSPLSFDEKIGNYLADLKRIANERPGDVVVVPFRLQGEIGGYPVYPTIRAGVTWSVWPSLYEPFGGVTEMYIHGTPVVAHDQGGLRQQVRDIERDGEERATGIIFRAPGDNLDSNTGGLPEDEQKRRELEQEHRKIQDKKEAPDRMQSWLYSQQVGSLSVAIMQACETYRYRPDQYGRILANLPEMAERISWDIPVCDYRQWYNKACGD